MLPLRPVQTERWMPAAPPRPAAGGHTGGNARGLRGGCQANAGGADHTQQAQAECGPFERWFAHDSAPFILHLLSAHRLCAMVRRFVCAIVYALCTLHSFSSAPFPYTPSRAVVTYLFIALSCCSIAAHILTLARARRRSVHTGVDMPPGLASRRRPRARSG